METSTSHPSPERTGGIVLCGGRSARMGTAKHLLPFGGRTMLQVVVATLSEVVAPVVVVRAADQQLPALPAGVLLAEDEESGLGPLAGLCAGLSMLEGACDAAFVASCDLPLLKPEFVRFLIDARGDREIAVVRDGDVYHVLAAVYSLGLLPQLRDRLRERRLRMQDVIDPEAARIVEPSELVRIDPELLSLRNANTPEEYDALRKIAVASLRSNHSAAD